MSNGFSKWLQSLPFAQDPSQPKTGYGWGGGFGKDKISKPEETHELPPAEPPREYSDPAYIPEDEKKRLEKDLMQTILSDLPPKPRSVPIDPNMGKKELGILRDAINRYKKKKPGLDLTPLAALTDAWTGSDLARTYNKPMNNEERQQIVTALETKYGQRASAIENIKTGIKQRNTDERNKYEMNIARIKSVAGAKATREIKREQEKMVSRLRSLKNAQKKPLIHLAALSTGKDPLYPDEEVKAQASLMHQKIADEATAALNSGEYPNDSLESIYAGILQEYIDEKEKQ